MRTWLAALSSAFVVGFLLAACGARDLEAPKPEEKPADLAACSFDHMMPNFVAAISTGRTQNLKNVVESQLLKPLREGDTPPAADVLRAVFASLDRYAKKGPEAGAASGEQCVGIGGTPPPLNQANELCEMRRMLQLFVHQKQPDGGLPAGIAAIRVIEPQLLGVMDYLDGNGTDHLTHYEVATVFSHMATNSGVCQMTDGLDLIIGFADYVNTPAGDKLVRDLNVLLGKPSIAAFLSGSVPADGGSPLTEDGFVAIARTLLPALQGADPAALENAFGQLPLPQELRADLRDAVTDLETLMGNAALVTPMKRSLNCYSSEDHNFDVIRMAYRLAIRDKKPEFGFTRLAGVLRDIKALDSRGSLMFIAGSLARGVRTDEQAIDSTSLVVHTLFLTEHYTICKEAVGAEPSPEVTCLRDGDCAAPQRCLPKARSNAELIVPTLADLVRVGVVDEAFCAIDTLVFGCAGGTQPACVR